MENEMDTRGLQVGRKEMEEWNGNQKPQQSRIERFGLRAGNPGTGLEALDNHRW